jgi:hypothetical protein
MMAPGCAKRVPESGSIDPAAIFRSVDLPEPLSCGYRKLRVFEHLRVAEAYRDVLQEKNGGGHDCS